MIKVEYILNGQAGELELPSLGSIDSEKLALEIHGSEKISDALADDVLDGVLEMLKLDSSESGDSWHSRLSPASKASACGFTKLIGRFENKVIFVV